MGITSDRKAALLARIRDFGGPINEPAVLAQFLAQVMHESGGLRYVREIWGPTKAQARYEGRKDLGNVRVGDGKRFMGRDVIQVTGRANHRALTVWVRETFGKGPDFEANPELLESPEWLGIGAIWYFLAARKDLIRYCREGNIEMVTRRVNGGLNGYADRLQWYDASALQILGFTSVKTFQLSAGLSPDGISGPKTRAAMHSALLSVKPASVTAARERVTDAPIIPGKRTDIHRPTQREAPGGAPVVAVVVAVVAGVAAAITGAWNWILGLFN